MDAQPVDQHSQHVRLRLTRLQARVVRALPDSLAVAALLATAALALVDGLLGDVVAAELDTGTFYYPLTALVWDELRRGSFPLWTPYIFGGYPLFADGELGLAQPLVLLALLAMAPDRAFVALRLAHLVIAGLGCYALARSWRLPPAAAMVAGAVFMLGSFLQAQIHHENVVRTAAWLPVALTAAERALRTRRRARLGWSLAGGGAVGMAGLGLHPQILVIDLLVLVAYGALRCRAGPIAGAEAAPLGRLVTVGGIWCGLVALGLGLAAVQLVPLLELGQMAVHGSLSYRDAAAYSFSPYGLIQLLFPFAFRDVQGRYWGLWLHWESYLYVGLAPLLLAALAIRFARRPEVWGWAIIGTLGFVLALGEYSPLNLHYVLWLLPGFSALRAPARFSLVVVLALAMLAAHGLAWLQDRASRSMGASPALRDFLRRALELPLVLTILLGALHVALRRWPSIVQDAVEAFYLSLPRDVLPLVRTDLRLGWIDCTSAALRCDHAPTLGAAQVYDGLLWATNLVNPRVLGGLAGLLAAALCVYAWQCAPHAAIRRWRGWPVVLVLLTVADLLVFGRGIHPRESLAALAAAPGSSPLLNYLHTVGDERTRYRVLVAPSVVQLAPNSLAPYRLEEAGGYSSLQSTWHSNYLRRVLRVDDALLDLWNVRYLVQPTSGDSPARYDGVDYSGKRPLLDGPTGGALAAGEFNVPLGFTVTELRVVSALVDAAAIAQDEPVAEVVFQTARGEILDRRELLAGRDVMEARWENLMTSGLVRHRSVEVARPTDMSNGDAEPAVGHASYTRIFLPEPVQPASVRVHSIPATGRLVIYGVALVEPSGRTWQLVDSHRTKYRELYRDRTFVLLENTAAYPRAFVVPRARFALPGQTGLEPIVGSPFEPSQEVVLPSDTPSEWASEPGRALSWADSRPSDGAAADGAWQAQVDRYAAAHASISVSTPEDGFLVLSDSYHPGWRAYVDGQEQLLLRGNVLFRAVPVSAGQHTVDFRFEPVSVRLGLAVTGLALAIAVGTLAAEAWHRAAREAVTRGELRRGLARRRHVSHTRLSPRAPSQTTPNAGQ